MRRGVRKELHKQEMWDDFSKYMPRKPGQNKYILVSFQGSSSLRNPFIKHLLIHVLLTWENINSGPQIRTAHALLFVFSAFLRACFPENCFASFHFSSLNAAGCKGCSASSHSTTEKQLTNGLPETPCNKTTPKDTCYLAIVCKEMQITIKKMALGRFSLIWLQ